ncbi:HAMP domain-containing protein [Bradyrhizobium tunisiense]|uniref:HAMP domain-containing protein n=1 Tax=Bradyrhizobium tunisiense TaxID=3278709 RepID=UPI0035D7B4DA
MGIPFGGHACESPVNHSDRIWSPPALVVGPYARRDAARAAPVVRPLSEITRTMAKFAAHDLDAEVPGLGRADEIGRMASALQVFKEAMINSHRHATEQAAEQAAKEQRTATCKLA